MTTPLSQFDKPQAEQYKGKRKLFLVPNYVFPPGMPDDAQKLLERRLGTVAHVYHETLYVEGDEGMELLEAMNPPGCGFIQAMCRSTAKLEATEDRALVEEHTDWQRCISMGLVSEKVTKLAMEGYRDTTQKRYEHISSRINETLQEDEAGVLFIREDHRVQFPSDVQVFYIGPPSLDALRRWLDDQMRAFSQPQEQQA